MKQAPEEGKDHKLTINSPFWKNCQARETEMNTKQNVL